MLNVRNMPLQALFDAQNMTFPAWLADVLADF